MFQVAFRRTSSLLQRSNVRLLSSSPARRNVVQELYLRELKNVKLSPITAKDAEGSVKPWSEPVKPSIPDVEAQGNDALKAYQDELVETKGSEAGASEDGNIEDDWLVLDDVEEESHSH
ncbi:hypothetical protein HG535_0G02240 [Zygotorulaspora mrakii]|uniref:ATP synthase subunit H, mitochondrial n=1 Tax=Zygotorulaspora mrakii TaxID=42260 RepID=A0A7H9B727_ZYGMR|nr:uncharacterized protein HG535_0G02240 [Zygotorulaspora mrakii]QLG74340.1 hypothetical protein HG535_0G02240 [Zygotorulaspora mrakii]